MKYTFVSYTVCCHFWRREHHRIIFSSARLRRALLNYYLLFEYMTLYSKLYKCLHPCGVSFFNPFSHKFWGNFCITGMRHSNLRHADFNTVHHRLQNATWLSTQSQAAIERYSRVSHEQEVIIKVASDPMFLFSDFKSNTCNATLMSDDTNAKISQTQMYQKFISEK